MSYELNQKQIDSVLSLPDEKRFYHFIARIVDWEEVWGLRTDSGWATVNSEGRFCIPFWPHPKYSEMFAKGDWDGYYPEKISLDDYVNKWLPGMVKDGAYPAIFPNLSMQGIVVEALRVLAAIDEELEKY
ncbi:MAG: DUF2750 domain-containing protein [Oleibacter sp.]|nr:DUF2750 domain-containing protein [Thalassolituus sp.]